MNHTSIFQWKELIKERLAEIQCSFHVKITIAFPIADISFLVETPQDPFGNAGYGVKSKGREV